MYDMVYEYCKFHHPIDHFQRDVLHGEVDEGLLCTYTSHDFTMHAFHLTGKTTSIASNESVAVNGMRMAILLARRRTCKWKAPYDLNMYLCALVQYRIRYL